MPHNRIVLALKHMQCFNAKRRARNKCHLCVVVWRLIGPDGIGIQLKICLSHVHVAHVRYAECDGVFLLPLFEYGGSSKTTPAGHIFTAPKHSVLIIVFSSSLFLRSRHIVEHEQNRGSTEYGHDESNAP